jgi:Tfp pilus assembly protein PilO
MTRTRRWAVGTALLVLLIMLAGWLLLVSPKRSEADDVRAQAAAQEAKNAELTSQISQLQAQQKQLPQQEAKLATIREQIPQTPALPPLVRTLSSIADSANVVVTALTPATPAALPTATGTAASAAAPTTSPDGTQLRMIATTITVQGTYYNIERFFSSLETMKRVALVTGFSIVPGEVATGSSSSTVTAFPAVGVSPTLTGQINARVFMSSVPPPSTTPGTTPGTPSSTTPK